MELEELKQQVRQSVDSQSQALLDLSHKIHANPELGYEEVQSSAWLMEYLEANGFEIQRGICDLPTAFKATYGEGKPLIAFMAEYDALPELGHACGHNVIGTVATGAAIASKVLADTHGCGIVLMGCPAEELLGGKVTMVDKGAFDDVDAALQIHCVPKGENWGGFQGTACISVDVEFNGKETHAAVSPWEGDSALQGLINAFNNINGLRLHLKDGSRIAGVITNGGTAPNVIPRQATGKFMLRSHDDNYLEEMIEKAQQCLEAAALSTGTTLKLKWGDRCYALRTNASLLKLWTRNMEDMGHSVAPINVNSGSTDVGNVSVTAPTIHPFLSILDGDFAFHSPEMREAAASPKGDEALLLGAKVLAMTAVDIVTQPDALQKAKQELWEVRKSLNLNNAVVANDAAPAKEHQVASN